MPTHAITIKGITYLVPEHRIEYLEDVLKSICEEISAPLKKSPQEIVKEFEESFKIFIRQQESAKKETADDR
jgi:hypothetical protein